MCFHPNPWPFQVCKDATVTHWKPSYQTERFRIHPCLPDKKTGPGDHLHIINEAAVVLSFQRQMVKGRRSPPIISE